MPTPELLEVSSFTSSKVSSESAEWTEGVEVLKAQGLDGGESADTWESPPKGEAPQTWSGMVNMLRRVFGGGRRFPTPCRLQHPSRAATSPRRYNPSLKPPVKFTMLLLPSDYGRDNDWNLKGSDASVCCSVNIAASFEQQLHHLPIIMMHKIARKESKLISHLQILHPLGNPGPGDLSSKLVVTSTLKISVLETSLQQGHSCNIGNAPSLVGKKLKTVICVFWMYIWYGITLTKMG